MKKAYVIFNRGCALKAGAILTYKSSVFDVSDSDVKNEDFEVITNTVGFDSYGEKCKYTQHLPISSQELMVVLDEGKEYSLSGWLSRNGVPYRIEYQ